MWGQCPWFLTDFGHSLPKERTSRATHCKPSSEIYTLPVNQTSSVIHRHSTLFTKPRDFEDVCMYENLDLYRITKFLRSESLHYQQNLSIKRFRQIVSFHIIIDVRNPSSNLGNDDAQIFDKWLISIKWHVPSAHKLP